MRQFTGIAFGLAAAIAAATGGAASAQVYQIGTNPQGSMFYSAGATISAVMVQKAGVQFRVAPYGGSSTYLPLINNGQLAFGMVNAAEAAFAYSGTELFKGRPNPNLREVLVTFPQDSGYMVRKDSPIKTIADLKGRRVPVEYVSGRIFHYIANANLATAGLSEKDLNGLPVPGFVDGVHAFMNGRVDAAYAALNISAAREAMATIPGGWRYLSLGSAPDNEAKMRRVIPSRPHAVRPGPNALGVVDDPTYLFSIDFTVVAGKDVPDDVVYKLVKTLYGSKVDLVKTLSAFNDFDPQRMAPPHPTPYHPGAIKFYKEVGLWPPK